MIIGPACVGRWGLAAGSACRGEDPRRPQSLRLRRPAVWVACLGACPRIPPHVSADGHWFPFERLVSAVPETPTHCRGGCGTELEVLRRVAGLCRACIAARASLLPPPAAPTDKLRTRMTVVREWVREHPKRERVVELRCSCGQRRVLKLSTFNLHRPHCCQRCRLRDVDRYGFEAELHAR